MSAVRPVLSMMGSVHTFSTTIPISGQDYHLTCVMASYGTHLDMFPLHYGHRLNSQLSSDNVPQCGYTSVV